MAAKCYLYLERYLCAGTGFLLVRLGPLGSFFRGKMFRRGPLIIQMRRAICFEQNETESILFLPFVVLAFIVGNFKHIAVERIK